MSKIKSNSIDLVLCDPPYGITQNKWDSPIDLDLLWTELKRIRKETTPIVLFSSQPFTTTLISSNLKEFKYCWTWKKHLGTGHLNAKKQPLRVIEDIIVFYKKQCFYNPQMRKGKPYAYKSGRNTTNYNSSKNVYCLNKGERYPVNILQFNRDENKLHPTQKPIDLLEYLIKTYSRENEVVLDFTMGSGSTGVACKNLNRRFIGIENNKDYYKICKSRLL